MRKILLICSLLHVGCATEDDRDVGGNSAADDESSVRSTYEGSPYKRTATAKYEVTPLGGRSGVYKIVCNGMGKTLENALNDAEYLLGERVLAHAGLFGTHKIQGKITYSDTPEGRRYGCSSQLARN